MNKQRVNIIRLKRGTDRRRQIRKLIRPYRKERIKISDVVAKSYDGASRRIGGKGFAFLFSKGHYRLIVGAKAGGPGSSPRWLSV